VKPRTGQSRMFPPYAVGPPPVCLKVASRPVWLDLPSSLTAKRAKFTRGAIAPPACLPAPDPWAHNRKWKMASDGKPPRLYSLGRWRKLPPFCSPTWPSLPLCAEVAICLPPGGGCNKSLRNSRFFFANKYRNREKFRIYLLKIVSLFFNGFLPIPPRNLSQYQASCEPLTRN